MFYLATNNGFFKDTQFINHGEIVNFTNDIREAKPFTDFINADLAGKYLSGYTFKHVVTYYAVVSTDFN